MRSFDAKALDREIPRISKDRGAFAKVEDGMRHLKTAHRLTLGDARDLISIPT